MKTAKGLHLWLATFGPYSRGFWITTRLRAPQVAIKRAQDAAKDWKNGGGGLLTFERIEHKGTIDA